MSFQLFFFIEYNMEKILLIINEKSLNCKFFCNSQDFLQIFRLKKAAETEETF